MNTQYTSTSTTPGSPPPFLFLQTFLPSSLPSLLPIHGSPHPPLCFSLTRLPLPTPHSPLRPPSSRAPLAAALLLLLLLLLLALPTTPVEILVYSTFILVTFRQRKSTCRMYRDFFDSSARDVDLIPGASSREETAYINVFACYQ